VKKSLMRMWELRGVADALGLEEVATLVGGDDFEAGADGETEAGDKGIPETDAIDVFDAGGFEEVAAGLIAGEEAVEDGMIHVGGGLDFCRCGNALGVGRRLDEAAEEPAGEPAEADFVSGRIGFVFESGTNGREVGVAGGAEVIEALADAPGGGSGLPVELLLGQVGEKLRGGVVVGV
jgi:hypothetical protein